MNKDESLQLIRRYATSAIGQQVANLLEHGEVQQIPQDPERYAVAAQCVLEGGVTCAGALSVEPSGALRVDQAAAIRDPNFQHAPPKPILAQHYFEPHRIVALVVIKKLDTVDQPKIIT